MNQRKIEKIFSNVLLQEEGRVGRRRSSGDLFDVFFDLININAHLTQVDLICFWAYVFTAYVIKGGCKF